eukprot:2924478-Amphidinium_carterae.1
METASPLFYKCPRGIRLRAAMNTLTGLPGLYPSSAFLALADFGCAVGSSFGIRSWARLSVQLKLQWAGHVARLPPGELPHAALLFFNL